MVSVMQQMHQEEVHVSFMRDRRGPCSWILNLLWLVIGGWHMFLTWFIVGLVLCLTIIGIPCGIQVLKISWFLLFPFGQSISYDVEYNGCCTCNCCSNCIWIIAVGWFLALQAVGTGIVFCLTCIGIPFGWQCFKLAYVCLWPFGADISADEIQTVTVVNTRTSMNPYTRLEEGQVVQVVGK